MIQTKMNLQNHCSIYDWEVYHLVNNTQSKFVTAVKREIKKEETKRNRIRNRYSIKGLSTRFCRNRGYGI